jgi:hypothetical protein
MSGSARPGTRSARCSNLLSPPRPRLGSARPCSPGRPHRRGSCSTRCARPAPIAAAGRGGVRRSRPRSAGAPSVAVDSLRNEREAPSKGLRDRELERSGTPGTAHPPGCPSKPTSFSLVSMGSGTPGTLSVSSHARTRRAARPRPRSTIPAFEEIGCTALDTWRYNSMPLS